MLIYSNNVRKLIKNITSWNTESEYQLKDKRFIK